MNDKSILQLPYNCDELALRRQTPRWRYLGSVDMFYLLPVWFGPGSHVC